MNDWLIWQMVDTAFPSGGFAHSAGLEAAVQWGELQPAGRLDLFLRESLLVNLLGTIVGLPLGLGLAHLIEFYYDTELFRFPVVTTPWVWINTMLLSLLFALLAHGFVQRAVHRLDWVEALNVKE